MNEIHDIFKNWTNSIFLCHVLYTRPFDNRNDNWLIPNYKVQLDSDNMVIYGSDEDVCTIGEQYN